MDINFFFFFKLQDLN